VTSKYWPAQIDEVENRRSLISEPVLPDNVATLVPRQRRSLHAIVAQNLADAEALIVRLEDGVAVADSQRPVIRDLYVQCEKQRELLEVTLQLGLE